jgi:hypothetical protein
MYGFQYTVCEKKWNRTVVQHVTGTGTGLLGEIPRVVVQKSALYKGPL